MGLIKKILLPPIPQHVIDAVFDSMATGENKAFEDENKKYKLDFYSWIPGNEIVQQWCNKNISPDIYWGIQVITKDMPIHKDLGTESKFNYIINSGGPNVITNYYNNDEELIESCCCDINTWYILNTKVKHDVKNIILGEARISIAGRITP